MQEEVKKNNYFIRLWRGQISLPMTYWVWGVFLTFVVTLISGVLFGIMSQNQSLTSNIMILSLGAIVLLYSFFILVSIWRSASNHDGSRIWANIAKIIVVINSFLIMQEVYIESKVFWDFDTTITKQIESINTQLPIKINEQAVLISAGLSNKTIYYTYKLDNIELDKNRPFNMKIFEDNIKKAVCKDGEVIEIIENNYSLMYKYRDKNEKLITQVHTDEKMCLDYYSDDEILKKILNENES